MIKTIQKKFAVYAKTFLTGNVDFDDAINLKLAHSLRVLDEAKKLFVAENISQDLRQPIELAALLHDYGRFEQFKIYKTYSDPRSCDHGDLSAELVSSHKLLDFLPSDLFEDTIWAIRFHNKLELPAPPTARAKLIAKVVRDADKLDIFPVIFSYMNKPLNTVVAAGLEKVLTISPAIYAQMINGKCSDKNDMRTIADFLVNKYAWAADLNFKYTKNEFIRRKYFSTLHDFLPKTKEFEDVYCVALKLLED